MRWLLICLISIFVITESDARSPGPAVVEAQTFDKKEKLDALFDQLAKETDKGKAKELATQIKHIWIMAPDEKTAEEMNQAIRAMNEFNLAKALALTNGIIDRHPDFAEAWNQRAYAHFLSRDYEKSLSDCRKTLELEPRHVGCMSGMARIYIRKQNRFEEGKEILDKAIKLYPLIYERVLLDEIPK